MLLEHELRSPERSVLLGAEEVQDWGLARSAALLIGRVPRIQWCSRYELPRAWETATRHKEADGSSHDRHLHMGLLREDGTPKPAFETFAPALGLCQWFPVEDHRLDDAVAWMRRLGVAHLRTGLSRADSVRPGALARFDRQMAALSPFAATVTFRVTPAHRGIAQHHTSRPLLPAEFAAFRAALVRRYS